MHIDIQLYIYIYICIKFENIYILIVSKIEICYIPYLKLPYTINKIEIRNVDTLLESIIEYALETKE